MLHTGSDQQIAHHYRELRHWTVFLVLGTAAALFAVYSARHHPMGSNTGLIAAGVGFIALNVIFRLCALAIRLYPRPKAIGIIILSLFTITLPFVIYVIYRKAGGYLRGKGMHTGMFDTPKEN